MFLWQFFQPLINSLHAMTNLMAMRLTGGHIGCKNQLLLTHTHSRDTTNRYNPQFSGPLCAFQVLSEQRTNDADMQYCRLVREVIDTGSERRDRTGTGTIAVFGRIMRFDLHAGFPLLTTKRMAWNSIKHELIWFISGNPSLQYLTDNNVRIWDGNAGERRVRFPDDHPDDMGPIYGFQWRHAGAIYDFPRLQQLTIAQYREQCGGIDQLADALKRLIRNPHDRRAVVCSWDPTRMHMMALPPCHVMFQLWIDGQDRVCMMMTQRSADLGLGVPFNIASYAALLCCAALALDRRPGELVLSIGDAHVYQDHTEQLEEQIGRSQFPPPELVINQDGLGIDPAMDAEERIDAVLKNLTADALQLTGYQSHARVQLKMSV